MIQLNTLYFMDLREIINNQILLKPNDFHDGRCFTWIGKNLLQRFHPELKYEDKTYYDFIDDKHRKIEYKNLTKYGLNLLPSKMVGSGRTENIIEWIKIKERLDLIYVVIDITPSNFVFPYVFFHHCCVDEPKHKIGFLRNIYYRSTNGTII